MPRAHRVVSLLKRWLMERIRGRSVMSIWTITLTNLRFDSTGGRPPREEAVLSVDPERGPGASRTLSHHDQVSARS